MPQLTTFPPHTKKIQNSLCVCVGQMLDEYLLNKWLQQYMLLLLLSRLSRVRLCAIPQTAAHQAPPSLGFSRQEHWSGLPFPSPKQESEKWKWSRSVMSDSSRPHGLQPTMLLRPWDSPGKSGVPSPSPCLFVETYKCNGTVSVTVGQVMLW